MKYYVVRYAGGVNIAHGLNARAVRDCYRADDPRAKVKRCPRWALKVYKARGVPFYEIISAVIRRVPKVGTR